MQRYMYDGNYRQEYPALSEEIYEVLERSDLKMKNAEYWRKRKHIKLNMEAGVVCCLKPQEESMEQSMELGTDYSDGAMSIEDSYCRKVLYHELYKCIRQLNGEEQEVLIGIFFLEQSQQEIANRKGINQSNVSRKMKVALAKMLKMLKHHPNGA